MTRAADTKMEEFEALAERELKVEGAWEKYTLHCILEADQYLKELANIVQATIK